MAEPDSNNAANPIRSDGLEVEEAEDGLVVFDPRADMVHHLNPTAAIIFDLSDGSRDPEEIARMLAQIYELDAPAREDALAGLRGLAERRLIRWEPHG